MDSVPQNNDFFFGTSKNIDIEYEYSLQDKGHYHTTLHKKQILMEMDFSFIFLLALGAIVDLHVKLRRADMEVEGHEEALVDVVVFCKLRPAALKYCSPSPSYQTSTSYRVPLPDGSRRTASRSSRPSINLVKFSGRR
jgi:hypothetical protein